MKGVKKEKEEVKLYSKKYFGLCGIGGIMACGITHTAICPVDVVKCKMQTGVPFKGTIDGFRQLLTKSPMTLTHGWAPTFVGYSAQGLGKFGLYEIFKYQYGKMLGHRNKGFVKTGMFMAASASAEFFADIFLCPWEAVKVKIQTADNYPRSLRKAMPQMYREGGLGVFYKGIVPLWTRQIPYTIIKFTTFERFVGMFYKYVFKSKPRNEYTKTQQLGVSFLSGYLAGIFCAIASHPPDVVVSKLNKNPGLGLISVSKSLSFKEMWSGLTPRIFMIGTLTALQWYIYDSFKTYNKFPTSGGH